MEENQNSQQPEVINSQNTVMKKNNACGMVSFIFSLIGIVIAGLPCGIVALITGIIGLTTFKPEKEKNKWQAITGLALGAVEIVIMLMYNFTV